jgi:methionyl-tRNA formyltransferase
MGTPAAAVASLERLVADGHDIAAVYTQPDRPAGRGKKVSPSPVKQFAIDNGLTVLQPERIRTPEAEAEFRAFSAEVAIVVAYGRILPAGFLDAFRFGAVNVHFSLLPKYRGAAPVNWAIVNGERTTGVTTMRMDAGLDTGDILMSRETDIGEDETAPELMGRLSGLGAGLLLDTIAALPTLKAVPQEDSRATYAPILKKEDGLIDWSLNAGQINDRVRGFQPFPGSYTFFRGQRARVWSARPLHDQHEDPSAAGKIISVSGGVIDVAVSGSTLRIIEIQFEGKRRMSAKDAINGFHIRSGEYFSNGPATI